jgi:hypothetical protein
MTMQLKIRREGSWGLKKKQILKRPVGEGTVGALELKFHCISQK